MSYVFNFYYFLEGFIPWISILSTELEITIAYKHMKKKKRAQNKYGIWMILKKKIKRNHFQKGISCEEMIIW